MAQLSVWRRIVMVITTVVILFVVCAARGQTPAHDAATMRSGAAGQGHSPSNLDPVEALVDSSVDGGVHADVLELSGAASENGILPPDRQRSAAAPRRSVGPSGMSGANHDQWRMGAALHSIPPASGSVNPPPTFSPPTTFSEGAPGSPLIGFAEAELPSRSGEQRPRRSRWRQREDGKRRLSQLQSKSHPQGGRLYVSARDRGLALKNLAATPHAKPVSPNPRLDRGSLSTR